MRHATYELDVVRPWKEVGISGGNCFSPLNGEKIFVRNKIDGENAVCVTRQDVRLATVKELVVLRVIATIDHERQGRCGEFAAWSGDELRSLCYATHEKRVVDRLLGMNGNQKHKRYRNFLDSFDWVEEMHERLVSGEQFSGVTLEGFVDELSGGVVDRHLYVQTLYERVQTMGRKLTLVNNTMDILRERIRKEEEEIESLKRKQRWLKKEQKVARASGSGW